jgi:hypothetical protein
MAPAALSAPVITRRAFFVCATLALAAHAATPPGAAPPLAQLGKPDAAEAARLIAQFRQSGIAGDYYLRFELHHLPRRGDETVYRGQLWGGRDDRGAVERVSLVDADGRERRWLLQHGEGAAVWRLAAGRAERLPAGAWFEPLVSGVELTAFDLVMPFTQWPGATVESIVRRRGRPAYAFLFRPPADFTAAHPQLATVRSYFDAQFNAPVQTELLGANGAVLKTLSLVDLKKVGEQWLPKSLDARDEATRDKTRLLVTGAALNLAFAPDALAPAALARELPAPPAESVAGLGP